MERGECIYGCTNVNAIYMQSFSLIVAMCHRKSILYNPYEIKIVRLKDKIKNKD